MIRTRAKWLLLSLLLSTFPGTVILAGTVTVTLAFDELPFQPVDGLSFQGVTFDFKIADVNSGEAFYNSFGPGSLTWVDDPSLTGDSTGILTFDFALPTAELQFGAALNTGNALSPGFTVELFDETLQSLGVTPVDTNPAVANLGFSEALFDYAGTPVVRAVVDFDDAPGSFAVDNLTYVVPEPASFVLIILGGLCLLRAARLTG